VSVIRFSVVLSIVAVAVGLLVAGAISGSLPLVYLAIAIAGVALLMLIVGVVVWRDEIFERASADGAEAPAGSTALAEAPAGAGAPAGSTARLGTGERDVAAATAAGPAEDSRPAGSVLAADAEPAAKGRETAVGPRVPDWPGLPGDRDQEARPGAGSGEPASAGNRRSGRESGRARAPDPWETLPRPAERSDGPPSVDELLRRARQPSGAASATGPAPASQTAATPAATTGSPASPLAGPPAGGPPRPETAGPKPGRPPAATPATASPPAASPATASQRPAGSQAASAGAGRPATATVRPSEAVPAAAPAKPSSSATPPAPPAPAKPSGGVTPPAPEASVSATPSDGEGGPDGAGPEPASSAQVTVVPGIGRYHRAECILIRFLGAEDLEVMSTEAAEAAGSVPCKACRPG
jgi:hypothetical protein